MIYLGTDGIKSAANGAGVSSKTKNQVSRRNWCWITIDFYFFTLIGYCGKYFLVLSQIEMLIGRNFIHIIFFKREIQRFFFYLRMITIAFSVYGIAINPDV